MKIDPPEGGGTARDRIEQGVKDFALRTAVHFVFGHTGVLDDGEKKDGASMRILRSAIGYSIYAVIDLAAGMNTGWTAAFLAGRAASQYTLIHHEGLKQGSLPQFIRDGGVQFFFGHTKEAEDASKARLSAKFAKAAGYSLYVVSFVASGTGLPWALGMTAGWYGLERGMAYLRRQFEKNGKRPPKPPAPPARPVIPQGARPC